MIRTASIARHPWGSEGYVRPQAISLPAEPFTIPPADRDETAPRSLPVRGKQRRVVLGNRRFDLSDRPYTPQYDEPQEVTL